MLTLSDRNISLSYVREKPNTAALGWDQVTSDPHVHLVTRLLMVADMYGIFTGREVST